MSTTLEVQLTRQLDVVRNFSALLAGLDNAGDVMAALAEHVAEAVKAMGAGITIAGPEGFICIPQMNSAVAAVEQAMVETQAGPAIDAVVQRRVVKAADVTAAQFASRWPSFGTAARGVEICGVVAIPMSAPGRVLGAVQIYRRQPTLWTEVDIAAVRTLAGIASDYVSQLEQLGAHRLLAEQLQCALTSRIDIEQAKGIAAVMLNTYTEDAFVELRKMARMNNTRLHDVCALLVSPYRREPGPLPVVDPVVAATIDNVLHREVTVPPQTSPDVEQTS